MRDGASGLNRAKIFVQVQRLAVTLLGELLEVDPVCKRAKGRGQEFQAPRMARRIRIARPEGCLPEKETECLLAVEVRERPVQG